MFLYALARYIADITDGNLVVNDWFYTEGVRGNVRANYGPGNRNRRMQADLLRLPVRVSEVVSIPWEQIRARSGRFSRLPIVEDQGQSIEAIRAVGADLILMGEFASQSAHLVSRDFRAQLRRDLTPLSGSFQSVPSYVQNILGAGIPTVAMQVRRGDYLRLGHLFAQLGPDYYLAAIEALGDGPKTILLFSDEPDRVVAEGWVPAKRCVVETGDILANLAVSMSCDSLIGANSTYSWWTAYLKADGRGKIIMPVTCHGIFPPSAIRVRPMERTDDEEGTTDGRADHWHLAGA